MGTYLAFFLWGVIGVIPGLLVLESFILIEKAPRRSLSGALIGSAIFATLPLLSAILPYAHGLIFPVSELIAAFIVYAWLMHHFSQDKLSWGTSFLVAFLMAITNFIAQMV